MKGMVWGHWGGSGWYSVERGYKIEGWGLWNQGGEGGEEHAILVMSSAWCRQCCSLLVLTSMLSQREGLHTGALSLK